MIPPMPPTFAEMQRESALTRALAYEATHTRCPSCEQMVDGVHSCVDAKLLRAVREAERKVVEASRDTLDAYDAMQAAQLAQSQSHGIADFDVHGARMDYLATRDIWLDATRALVALRGAP